MGQLEEGAWEGGTWNKTWEPKSQGNGKPWTSYNAKNPDVSTGPCTSTTRESGSDSSSWKGASSQGTRMTRDPPRR
eukprot:12907831-Prorocentrum_lima.AAC.1